MLRGKNRPTLPPARIDHAVTDLHSRNVERMAELLSFPASLHETPENEADRNNALMLGECNKYLMSILPPPPRWAMRN